MPGAETLAIALVTTLVSCAPLPLGERDTCDAAALGTAPAAIDLSLLNLCPQAHSPEDSAREDVPSEVPVHGRLMDIAGRPIVGARVSVCWADAWSASELRQHFPSHDAITMQTNEAGEFGGKLPATTTGPDSGCVLWASGPGMQPLWAFGEWDELQGLVLRGQIGRTVRGRLVDAAGRPIVPMQAEDMSSGMGDWVVDENGFEIRGCVSDSGAIAVAPAPSSVDGVRKVGSSSMYERVIAKIVRWTVRGSGGDVDVGDVCFDEGGELRLRLDPGGSVYLNADWEVVVAETCLPMHAALPSFSVHASEDTDFEVRAWQGSGTASDPWLAGRIGSVQLRRGDSVLSLRPAAELVLRFLRSGHRRLTPVRKAKLMLRDSRGRALAAHYLNESVGDFVLEWRLLTPNVGDVRLDVDVGGHHCGSFEATIAAGASYTFDVPVEPLAIVRADRCR